jgi:hypothetical protein
MNEKCKFKLRDISDQTKSPSLIVSSMIIQQTWNVAVHIIQGHISKYEAQKLLSCSALIKKF